MMTTLRSPLLWMIGCVLLIAGGRYVLMDLWSDHWINPALILLIAVASVAAALSVLFQTKEWSALSAGLLAFFSGSAVLWIYALVGPRDALGTLQPDAVEIVPVKALLAVGAIFTVYGMVRGSWDSFRFRSDSDRLNREGIARNSEDIARIGEQLTAMTVEARGAARDAVTEAVEARSAARDAATEAVEARSAARDAATEALASSDERTRIALEDAAKQKTLLEVKGIVSTESTNHEGETT